MTGKCWFCNIYKEESCHNVATFMAYGFPHPVIELSIQSGLSIKGETIYFICEKCKDAILQVIAKSGILTKENVLDEIANKEVDMQTK